MGYTHFDKVVGKTGVYAGDVGSEVQVADSSGALLVGGTSLATAVYAGSTTWDPGSIADGDMEAKDITVTGAALGDFCLVSFSLDVADLVLNGQVTAADTVTAILANNTGGAVDLASGTVSAIVISRA